MSRADVLSQPADTEPATLSPCAAAWHHISPLLPTNCVPHAAELVAKVSDVFQPRNLSVALSTDTAAPGTSCAAAAWGAAFAGPLGYACHSASYQEMKCGGCVAYFVLEQGSGASPGSGPGSPVRGAGKCAPGTDSDSGSPRAVIKHFPSFSGTIGGSMASGSVLADMDLLGMGSDNASDNSSVRA